MSEEYRIPIVQEEAHVFKRAVTTDRVTVRTSADEHQVVIRDELWRGHVTVDRVAIEREVTEAPPVRTEGEVTIVPVVEERLVVEKRLFLVEELRLTAKTRSSTSRSRRCCAAPASTSSAMNCPNRRRCDGRAE